MMNQAQELIAHFKQCPEPDRIAEAILHAFTADTPRRRYLVGTRDEISVVIERMFQEIGQLNGKHDDSLPREELISYLDKYLEWFLNEIYDKKLEKKSWNEILLNGF